MDELLHVIVKGRVQGVGYRHFTTVTARRMGLTGWVRNLDNGDVEVLARVPISLRQRFLATLQQGPAISRVEAVEVLPADALEPPPAEGFHVRR